jgi:riboflavin synthase
MVLVTKYLDQCVKAILARDIGIPYPEVLRTNDLTPSQFNLGVSRLDDLIRIESGKNRRSLEEIASDNKRRIDLFRMGEEFIMEQYLRIHGEIEGEQQKIYFAGTYTHPENVQLLVYCALTHHNSQLASTNRAEVIQGIKDLPINLKDYLHHIGLGGLMVHAFEKEEQGSPLAVLKAFDKIYQQKTGDEHSLFDLSQKLHLHGWGDNFEAPNHYWQDPSNVETAVYHTLTETNSKLASTNRAEVIQGIKDLPTNLKNYLYNIGLNGLMIHGFEKEEQGSPKAVLKAFDRAYQRKTGDVSLFDQTQPYHLEFDSNNILIR